MCYFVKKKEAVYKKIFVITIDTEADHTPTWIKTSPLSFFSVTSGIFEKFQPLANKYGAKPSYLLSSEIMESAECVRIFKNLKGEFELGVHMHGEYLNPDRTKDDYAGTKSSEFASSYPEGTERGKLKTITDMFFKSFGQNPRSYRAGKFGISENTFAILKELDYFVDTSVTPHTSWASIGGPDFCDYPEQPYFPLEHSESILEVPVTIVPIAPLWGFLAVKGIGPVNRLREKYFSNWLRPSFTSSKRMLRIMRYVEDKNRHQKIIVFNMMFHSMELVPKASPYAASDKEVEGLLGRIEKVFQYCRQEKIEFMTLRELRREAGK